MATTRYELRKTASGWTAWDPATGTPAVVKGVWQVDLELEAADELTDALNWLADRAPEKAGAT
jgi:hypothetical protein